MSPCVPRCGASGVGMGSAMNADQALQRLRDGNERFVSGKRIYPLQDGDRVGALVKGQEPFAAVLCCSDSRVPPEHIFDAGLGELFVVRVAGNVCSEVAAGSLEYAIEHLQTPLLVVLGHTGCGAVSAAVQQPNSAGSASGEQNLNTVLRKIEPAVKRAKGKFREGQSEPLESAAVRENVWLSIESLLESSHRIRARVQDETLIVSGSMYHLETGRVEWLEPRDDSRTEDPGKGAPMWKGMYTSSSRSR